MNSISVKGVFVNRAREVFAHSGIPVSEWARSRGFSADLVYQVLEGKRRCLRGQSHRIAVELGLKEGKVMTLEQLTASLLEKRG